MLIEALMPWGPVFFGLLILAPMWAAATGLSLPLLMALGGAWGLLAKIRGRWV